MEKNIQHIELPNNRALVFGGPYSNLHALRGFKKIAKSLGFLPSEIICTGDVVGYCAFPDETARLVMDWGIHCISGNVEQQLAEGLDDCGCNFEEGSRCDVFAKQWFPFAKQATSAAVVDWMRQLPDHVTFELGGKKALVLHGSWFNTSEFVFKSTPWAVKDANFSATESDVILAGHCGLPFFQEVDGKAWLNAGVIGMPANDGTSRVWYLILELESGKMVAKHHFFEYDCIGASEAMMEHNLPLEYSITLESGLWDNNDILPDVETAAQGKLLMF